MPLVYSLSDITSTLPPTLVGVLDADLYRRLVEDIQKTNSNGCCLGGCFTFGCTLVLGPIGLIIGLCSCPFIWHGYSNEHSRAACSNMNNIHFGGRRIFEWHDNGTLWIYPENRYDTVISVQPTVGQAAFVTPASAVYVQEAYYVSPQQPGSNVTVVQATVSPLTQQNQPYQPHTVTNSSYQPAAAAYAPPDYDANKPNSSNNV